MKKIFCFTLSIAFLAVITFSCAKSTKGKMVIEWKIVSYSEVITTKNPNGNVTTSSSSSNGSETPNEMIIKKDGTWSLNRKLTESYTEMGGQVSVTNNTYWRQSGVWSFVKGTNHKLVCFDILYEATGISPLTNSSDSKAYLEGENTITYTIEESTNEKLRLSGEKTNFNSSGDFSTSKIRIALKEKK